MATIHAVGSFEQRSWECKHESAFRHYSVDINGDETFDQSEKVAVKPGHPRFHRVLADIGDLHALKAADYGTGADPFANIRASVAFGVPAWVGAILRGNDKMTRIQSFITNGKLANEAVEDSLLDLASYAIIALVLYLESTEQREEVQQAA